MSHGERKSSLWPLLVTVPVLAIAVFAAAFWFQAEPVAAGAATSATTNAAAVVPTATFAANSATLGAIPDSNVGTPACQNNSTTMRDVTFTASGLSGSIQSVSVDFRASHTWIQDLEVTLIAPSAQQLLLFSATGTTSTVANTCLGNSNDLNIANTYTFADSASANWWTTASSANPIPTSTSRTVVTGIGGAPNPPPTTSLNTAFAAATPNGTWTLRFRDRGAGDTGAVAAANLTITTGGGGGAGDGPFDYDGDGRTDFVTVRNVGGGPSGQIRWFYNLAAGGPTVAKDWGLATDFFLGGNIDGDNNDDIIVWRPGSPGAAAFYALRSTNFTAYVEPFGQSGDDPTVIQDYSGDGKTDWAVYRSGLNPGDPSTWYWRNSTTPGGAVNYVPWGQNGDFPAPGDFDGDAKADFVVQRDNGGGQARFWMRRTMAGDTSFVFGTATDAIVPGDYDGDGSDDIAVVRGIDNVMNWFYEPSGTAGITVVQFAFGNSVTDYPTQGDYDGDGRTDAAIWRPSGTAGASAFWIRNTASSAVSAFPFGEGNDYPPANFNTH